MRVNPYLNFNGNCKEAFEVYAKVFHTEIEHLMAYGDSPMHGPVPPGWSEKVMHIAMKIGETLVFGSDAMPQYYEKPAGLSVSVTIEDIAESERVFAELSEGAKITMPLQEVFWAHRFGMLTDRFGTPWMINCEKPMPAQS